MTSSSGRHAYKQLGLPQLRNFCVVCRLGGYAAAARDLHMTAPALWEQVKSLERHLGVELLDRVGNRVRPNLQGRRLLDLIGPHLAGLESARDVLQQTGGALPERLTIVSNMRVLVDEISRAMSRFRERFPSVALRMRYLSIEEVPPLVLDGSADVTLTLEPGPDDQLPSGIVFEPAADLEYLLVTRPRHPLLTARSLRLEAIVEQPLVLGEAEAYSRHRVQEVFHRHNLTDRLHVVTETSSDEYTLACVRAGLGIGIAIGNPRSPIYHGLGVRSLRRWFGAARVGFMWRRGAHVAPLQQELADLVSAGLKRSGAH
jgi:DNA-binding transcriptional LysR family regulator